MVVELMKNWWKIGGCWFEEGGESFVVVMEISELAGLLEEEKGLMAMMTMKKCQYLYRLCSRRSEPPNLKMTLPRC